MNRLPRLVSLALIFPLAVIWLTGVASSQESRGNGNRGESRGPQPQTQPQEVTIDKGLVFVDGVYLPSPYVIRVEGDAILINDRQVQTIAAEPVRQPPREDFFARSANPVMPGESRGRPGGFPGRNPGRSAVNDLSNRLSTGCIVVYLAGQPQVTLDNSGAQYDLLSRLLARTEGQVTPAALTDQLPPDLDRGVWNQWIATYVPSDEFQTRATGIIDLYDRTLSNSLAEVAATNRLHNFAYPLSAFGMLLTTLGMGHLLSQRPPVGAQPRETDLSPLALRAVKYSLGMVVLFSALDLTWTILASQAGQMRELNPLGSHLIENPLGLIAFKVSAIGLAVGLLLLLRRYKRAQLAAWWICLICTLLTARWLMLNSMFIA